MKKFGLLITVAIMVNLTFGLGASAKSQFVDVSESHWASKEIDFLTGKQIIYGYKDDTFKPNNSITRLQSVMMILREKGVTDTSKGIIDPGFVDMKPGQTGYADVAKAVELGIIDGMVNEKGQRVFKPQGTLTRAQMAKTLALGYDLTGVSNTTFTDVPKTHWSYAYIQALAKNGITAGYSNGRFGAGESLTRAQFASMMARLLDKSFVVTPPATKPDEPAKPSNPDGWTAPVLKSKWSPNQETNFKTLQNELGFKDDGRVYGVKGSSRAIQVIGQAPTDPYEVQINFLVWQDAAIPDSYKVPIVANELFKLYFDKDANKVWNYFDKNDIPERFTASGRNVVASLDTTSGAIVIKIGRK